MAKLFLFVDCQKNGVTSANIIFLRLCVKGICIQLFRQRLSKKSVNAYATMPKGSLGNAQ